MWYNYFMKRIAVLYSEYTPLIDALKYGLKDYAVDCLNTPEDMAKYDLVIISDYKGKYEGDALACHHSLLPAFESENPEKDAILAGAKVTGVTIFFTNPKKIIAQYPIFIKNDTHYDELRQELTYVEQTLLPLVAQKILNNEPFEVSSLLNKTCSGSCGGCSSCNH